MIRTFILFLLFIILPINPMTIEDHLLQMINRKLIVGFNAVRRKDRLAVSVQDGEPDDKVIMGIVDKKNGYIRFTDVRGAGESEYEFALFSGKTQIIAESIHTDGTECRSHELNFYEYNSQNRTYRLMEKEILSVKDFFKERESAQFQEIDESVGSGCVLSARLPRYGKTIEIKLHFLTDCTGVSQPEIRRIKKYIKKNSNKVYKTVRMDWYPKSGKFNIRKQEN